MEDDITKTPEYQRLEEKAQQQVLEFKARHPILFKQIQKFVQKHPDEAEKLIREAHSKLVAEQQKNKPL